MAKSTGKKKGPQFHFSDVERAHMANLSDEFHLAKRGTTQNMTDLWDKVAHQIIAISPERGQAPQSARKPQREPKGDELLDEENGGQDETQVGIDCASAEEASATKEVFKVLRKVITLRASRLYF